MKVAVVGLGKLGAPLAGLLAEAGQEVLGIDNRPEAVRAVEAGHPPVEETDLAAVFAGTGGRLRASTSYDDLDQCEVAFVVVPTPSLPSGAFDLQYVVAAVGAIGRAIADSARQHVVVITSTVLPGGTNGEIRSALEAAAGRAVGTRLGLCYSPEFIALGSVVRDMRYPDVVLAGGSEAWAVETMIRALRPIWRTKPPVRRLSLVDAEVAKIAVNTYVTMKISFANMLGELCERLPGADVDEVTGAIGLDSRIGPKYLKGATAYGGPCFPRDNAAFAAAASEVGLVADLALATESVNRRQVARLRRLVGSYLPMGGTVAICGLSYKPSTSVVDESVGIALANALLSEGISSIVWDPAAGEAAASLLHEGARHAATLEDAVADAGVVVITTPWEEFATLPPTRSGGTRVVIDCWGIVQGDSPDRVIRVGRSLDRGAKEEAK